MTTTMTMTRPQPWVAPPMWTVPRLWPEGRVFVICGGESVRTQRHLVPHLPGPVIAVKEGVYLRPAAEIVFFAGERPEIIAPPVLAAFRGDHIVVRGKGHPVFPATSKRVGRTDSHQAWSSDPTRVAGYDSGTSAISLAILCGARDVIVLGYDMQGGRWFNGEKPHFLPHPPERDFQIHMSVLPALAADAARKGIRIVNTSPATRVTAFEQRPLEEFL